jgi:hypothetical protein
MISLFLSSPCTWKKRSLGILVGILLMAPALYLYMRFLIWDESSYIELTAVSWKWREWVTDIRRILGIIMSCSLAVSIWFSIMLTQTKTAKSVKYV